MSMPRYAPIANLFWMPHEISDNLAAGPTPAPHTTRFVVRSDELINSKYGLSAPGAERRTILPSDDLRNISV